jgi:anti-sigma28 factor (negative regulator of flagellin synthesis)
MHKRSHHMSSSSENLARRRARPGLGPSPGRLRLLREQLAAGTYEVSPERLAEAMIAAGAFRAVRRSAPPA